MNSRVAFRVGARRDIEIRTLVYPDQQAGPHARADCVSVLTPLGAALIGLRVGSGMAYETADSTMQHVTVEAVIHQPDAAAEPLGSIGGSVRTTGQRRRGRPHCR